MEMSFLRLSQTVTQVTKISQEFSIVKNSLKHFEEVKGKTPETDVTFRRDEVYRNGLLSKIEWSYKGATLLSDNVLHVELESRYQSQLPVKLG